MRPRAWLALVLLSAAVPVLALDGTTATHRPVRAGSAGGGESEQQVERIISLVPAATEVLFAIGAGDRVVGVSSYDRWPERVEALPRVGALLDPDTEKIISLRPDLVVVDPAHVSLSRQLASMNIVAFPWPTGGLDGFYRRLADLGDLVELPGAARALEEDLRASLRAIAAAVPDGPRPRTLLVFGRRPGAFAELWVSGGVGFLHELVEIAGGENRFADLDMQSFKAGLEVLLADPPDVVIESVSDRASSADRETIVDQWRSLPGFGEVEVGVLAGGGALVPGPRMAETVRAIAQTIAESHER